MKSLYLIQHINNGYVHCVFSNLPAAKQFINRLNKVSSTPGMYHIVERYLFDNISEIGG